MVVCAIDPGLTGGVAILEDIDTAAVHDMPVIADRTGGKKSVDINALIDLIPEHAYVVVEEQQSMPKQGVASTFQTGKNYGVLIGMLEALAFRYDIVRSREWSKTVGKPAKTGKDWNIACARRMFPHLKGVLLKSKDGRADALLIALHGMKTVNPEADVSAPPVAPETKSVELPNW